MANNMQGVMGGMFISRQLELKQVEQSKLKVVRTYINVLFRRHFLNYLTLSMRLLPRINVLLDFI